MAEATKETKPKKTIKSDQTYYEGVGRRRTAVARVRAYILKKGNAVIGENTHKGGSFIINNQPIEKIFCVIADQLECKKPLVVADSLNQYVVSVRVSGGGVSSQVEAIAHGLARALTCFPSADLKSKLRIEGLLTRDSRTRERRKVGTGGKARRLKQSPKR